MHYRLKRERCAIGMHVRLGWLGVVAGIMLANLELPLDRLPCQRTSKLSYQRLAWFINENAKLKVRSCLLHLLLVFSIFKARKATFSYQLAIVHAA